MPGPAVRQPSQDPPCGYVGQDALNGIGLYINLRSVQQTLEGFLYYLSCLFSLWGPPGPTSCSYTGPRYRPAPLRSPGAGRWCWVAAPRLVRKHCRRWCRLYGEPWRWRRIAVKEAVVNCQRPATAQSPPLVITTNSCKKPHWFVGVHLVYKSLYV